MLVSAIVSTYNAERYMRGLLEDLENQTIASETEIIVIDSGSEQNERAIIDEFSQRYDNIVYVRTPHESTSLAVNRAIQMARGKYLTIANTDDRHRRDAFEVMAAELDKRDVGVVYGDSLITKGTNETFESNTAYAVFRWPDYSLRQLLQYCCVGPQPMWRRDVRIGLFTTQLLNANDYEFFIRLCWKYGGYHIPEILGLYLEGGRESQNAGNVHADTRWVLNHYRSIIPLDDIYNISDSVSRGTAMVDYAKALSSGLFPDHGWAQWYKDESKQLLGDAIPPVINDLPPLKPSGAVRTAYIPSVDLPISFCIITAGKRPELLNLVIKSIRAQNIPKYEIIIAGNHQKTDGIVYVPAKKAATESRRGELRNVAMARAQYQNIMFLDDDCFLNPDWYAKLKEYGSKWDILTPQFRVCDGSRFWDNATINGPRGQIVLDPDDYDDHVYATSGAMLIKDYVAKKAKWRDDLTYFEDVEFSRTCQALGFRISHAHGSLVWHADNSVTLVGRQILRKGQGGGFGWVLTVCDDHTIDEIVKISRDYLDIGAVTQAADCIRYGLYKEPNHSELNTMWLKLQQRFGGILPGARWFADKDPEYTSALETYGVSL